MSTQNLPRPRRLPAAAAVLALGAGLAACGDDTPDTAEPTEVVVTVTATPSAKATASPRATAKPAAVKSDVKGRDYDFGLVVGRRTVSGTDVLVLDRWTDPRVPDDRLAKQGVEVAPWKIGSGRYRNQNTEKTFDIPVREGTSFLLNHCIAMDEPVTTRSVSAKELADAPESDRLLLVELDGSGYATAGQTVAGC